MVMSLYLRGTGESLVGQGKSMRKEFLLMGLDMRAD
jgi:hypothetical protein